jgi:hypothetical protein
MDLSTASVAAQRKQRPVAPAEESDHVYTGVHLACAYTTLVQQAVSRGIRHVSV